MKDAAIVDPSVYESIYAVGGSELLVEMLTLFLSQIARYSHGAEIALVAQDHAALEAHLHALRSAASSLGFVSLQRSVRLFEKAAQAQMVGFDGLSLAENWRKEVVQAKAHAQNLLSANEKPL